MEVLDLPRWLYKWILGLFMKQPAKFFAMRYYDVKNFFEEKESSDKEVSPKKSEAGVRKPRSSGKTFRRPH